MLDQFYDELHVGRRWESRGRTITEADIVNFAAFTGDWYPLHTDQEWAAKTQFGQRIAHGLLVLSVASGLLTINPGVVLAFYGMEKVRFTSPTFIGDTIHVESEVVAKEDREPGGVVSFKKEVKNQRGETVLLAYIKVLCNRRSV